MSESAESRTKRKPEGFRKAYGLITAATIALVLSGCSDGSSSISDAKLEHQDPLVVARHFVQTVQEPTDIETYNRFQHPESQVEKTPDGKGIGEFYFKNALSENKYIDENDLLNSPRINVENGRAGIFYVLPSPIKYDIVYPHSPFADEEKWVIREGQILLENLDGRWVIIGHTMVGEEETP